MQEDVHRLYTNTVLFYIRNLSIHRFWYRQGRGGEWPGTNPPANTKRYLYKSYIFNMLSIECGTCEAQRQVTNMNISQVLL